MIFLFADKSKLGHDDISFLRTIIEACVGLFTRLTEECIRSIHVSENKRSDLNKLLQMKLACSLEHIASFAKMAFEIESVGENQGNKPMLFAVLRDCTQCTQAALTDLNILVIDFNVNSLFWIYKLELHAYICFEIIVVGPIDWFASAKKHLTARK